MYLHSYMQYAFVITKAQSESLSTFITWFFLCHSNITKTSILCVPWRYQPICNCEDCSRGQSARGLVQPPMTGDPASSSPSVGTCLSVCGSSPHWASYTNAFHFNVCKTLIFSSLVYLSYLVWNHSQYQGHKVFVFKCQFFFCNTHLYISSFYFVNPHWRTWSLIWERNLGVRQKRWSWPPVRAPPRDGAATVQWAGPHGNQSRHPARVAFFTPNMTLY